MSVIDIGIIVFALAMAAIGWERGLVGSAPPLLGFVAGVAIGARLGPELLAGGASSPYAPAVAAAGGVLLGLFMAIALDGIGEVFAERIRAGSASRVIDGLGGALLLGVLALVICWVVGAVALTARGQQNRGLREAIQDSTVLAALNKTLPPSGPLLNSLRRIDPSPAVRGPNADVSRPSRVVIRGSRLQVAARSVVRVLSTACGLGIQGSGWIAGPNLVVTNAHVVAGSDDTEVSEVGGPELDATVVHFEPRNDIAVLRVSGLTQKALPLERSPRRGTPVGAAGYPENGGLLVTAGRLGRTGFVTSEDSYGRGPVRRRMTPFRGRVTHGNSGGPLIDARGGVAGTVFATQVGSGPSSGLAVPDSIVRRALSGPLRPTSTQACTG